MNTNPPTPAQEPINEAPVLRPALVLFAVLTLVTGLLYPLLVTGVAQTVFPDQANGSLVERDGKAVGSTLIGQSFTQPENFWSRPSATGPMAYNAGASSGSNLGPGNPALADAVRARIEALRAADPGNTAPVPVDLITTSASGLDPHISLAAARYQVARVARERGLAPDAVNALVEQHTEKTLFGFLGEPRVNVLTLNLALGPKAASRAP
ncbi:MAG: potassium-transporting ATPase subunit C [Burkholderiales bacterium]|nr:MAG: potassium-transporting ATPase subunit C [Burkholderiales bacterium]